MCEGELLIILSKDNGNNYYRPIVMITFCFSSKKVKISLYGRFAIRYFKCGVLNNNHNLVTSVLIKLSKSTNVVLWTMGKHRLQNVIVVYTRYCRTHPLPYTLVSDAVQQTSTAEKNYCNFFQCNNCTPEKDQIQKCNRSLHCVSKMGNGTHMRVSLLTHSV